jgi:hypothetical protein
MTHTPEFAVWSVMKGRCRNPRNRQFPDYGARGIRVCERWDSFATFISDMGRRPSDKHSIERIDNDGDYEPGNCRWALQIEQNRNSRHNHLVDIGRDQLVPMSVAAEVAGLSYHAMKQRVRKGVSGAALVAPPLSPREASALHWERRREAGEPSTSNASL